MADLGVILGGAGTALALISITLHAERSYRMATNPKAQFALAKIAAISAALGAALAEANAAGADLDEVNTSLDNLGAQVPGYVAPADPSAPAPEQTQG